MASKKNIIGSASGLLAVAAFSGLLAGAVQTSRASTTGIHQARPAAAGTAGVKAVRMDSHSCKGANSCKGTGGCSSGDNGCKGKNSCKGKGGCSTATTAPSSL